MALTKESTELYKAELQKEHARLMREIGETSKPEDFGSDVEGEAMEEEAEEGEALANRLALTQALKDRVNEIEGAFNRIEGGTYGVCEQCGGDISKEVLDLAPESSLCADCKKKL
jgi:DnaK suppressor protein